MSAAEPLTPEEKAVAQKKTEDARKRWAESEGFPSWEAFNASRKDDGPLDPLERLLAEAQARAAEHRASCKAQFCEACERYACNGCHAVRVAEHWGRCRSCDIRRAIDAARVPPRYASADLDDASMMAKRLKSKSALALARQRSAWGEGKPVVAKGQIGTGKSTSLGGMVRLLVAEMVDQRRPFHAMGVLWVSAIDLEVARSQHRLGAEAEAELVQEAIDARLLIIDDLGAESPRGVDAISCVVHARHDRQRPIWISTGLSAGEIGARYTGGIERRLFEGAVLIDCSKP